MGNNSFFILFITALLSMIWASFLSTFAYRLSLLLGIYQAPLKQPIQSTKELLFKPSFCDYCHRPLALFNLIPLFHLLFNGGKCRYCNKQFGLYYSINEIIFLLLCLVFVSFYNHSNFISLGVLELINWSFLSLLMVNATIDKLSFILLDSLSFLLLCLALLKFYFIQSGINFSGGLRVFLSFDLGLIVLSFLAIWLLSWVYEKLKKKSV